MYDAVPLAGLWTKLGRLGAGSPVRTPSLCRYGCPWRREEWANDNVVAEPGAQMVLREPVVLATVRRLQTRSRAAGCSFALIALLPSERDGIETGYTTAGRQTGWSRPFLLVQDLIQSPYTNSIQKQRVDGAYAIPLRPLGRLFGWWRVPNTGYKLNWHKLPNQTFPTAQFRLAQSQARTGFSGKGETWNG